MSYNGWTNYATWRINLEMFNGVDAEDMGYDKLEAYELADILKEYATEILESEFPNHKRHGTPLVLSYALAFLDDVNWREIANHILEDCAA